MPTFATLTGMGTSTCTPRALALVLVALVSTGCATTMVPVHPSGAASIGQPVDGVRFDRDKITFREPGAPISTGHIWRREVAQYSADQLNTLIDADPAAPAAETTVTMELHTGSVLSLGSSKELTVTMATTLPDGRRVVSEPRSGFIDNNVEYLSQQCLIFAGPILEVVSFVVAIFMLANFGIGLIPTLGIGATPGPGWALCGCLLFSAATGLILNGVQLLVQNAVAFFQERRASDVFLDALSAHADDVRRAIQAPPPTKRAPPAAMPAPADAPPPAPADDPEGPPAEVAPPPAETAPPPAETAPPPDEAPPPILHDPADPDPKAFRY